ncbi:hypothetical protein L1785_17970 [Antribacter sp. KLBMP9083]|uniref:Nitroreductase n=1 Tax=Antribacter soli TaxID=2910976 RepID=A0AA41QG67_9MICO|nr:hypothetical protein [Antribacter soli]MCF4122868.1 hypothetical protein [Antribacter soli]
MAAPEMIVRAAKRFNPYALKMSSHLPPWATVHHVGRRSGKQYATPVVAFAARAVGTPDIQVLTPLPWGATTDWTQNVLAAGSYRMTRDGVDYRVDRLRLVDKDEADPLLATAQRTLLSLIGVEEYVAGRLSREPTT